MAENNCYLCQEPKSVVGHNTQSCPSVKCKKCGQNGHIIRNCPNFNTNMDQKSVFLEKFELKHHIKGVHLKKKTFNIQCSKCKASFTKKEYLQKHIQKFHQEIKTYKCDKCELKFENKFHLMFHKNRVEYNAKEKEWKKILCK